MLLALLQIWVFRIRGLSKYSQNANGRFLSEEGTARCYESFRLSHS